MAKHVDSYLCKVCWKIVAPALSWAGRDALHVKASCPDCGLFFKFVTQTPDVVAKVGPPPVRSATPDLFGECGT